MSAPNVQLRLVTRSHEASSFSGIPTYCPVNIVILAARAADHAVARRLYEGLSREFAGLGNRVTEPATGEVWRPESQNLLVYVASASDGSIDHKDILDHWLHEIEREGEASSYRLLPVLEYRDPDRPQMAALRAIDSKLGDFNVAWWRSDVHELIPQTFLVAGVVSNEFRLFISYKRDDCQALADQLFSALVKEGFTVFLDRFSVPQGALFQRFLTEQLEDKSMVMVLETPNFAASAWTMFEVAFAKKRRLGICTVTFPQVVVDRGRDPFEAERRLTLKDTDFKPANPTPDKASELDPEALNRVVQFVKREHNIAYLRRREMMLKELDIALRLRNLGPCQWDSNGNYLLTNGNKQYKFSIVPRPAELSNLYDGVHRAPNPPGTVFVVISPYLKSGSVRRSHLDWVTDLSDSKHFDSTRVPLLALMIKKGRI